MFSSPTKSVIQTVRFPRRSPEFEPSSFSDWSSKLLAFGEHNSVNTVRRTAEPKLETQIERELYNSKSVLEALNQNLLLNIQFNNCKSGDLGSKLSVGQFSKCDRLAD